MWHARNPRFIGNDDSACDSDYVLKKVLQANKKVVIVYQLERPATYAIFVLDLFLNLRAEVVVAFHASYLALIYRLELEWN